MSFLHHFAKHPRRQSEAKATGDRLLATWGFEASNMARIMAFCAKAGLLYEAEPGFWAGVAHAIGVPDDVTTGTNLLAP